jgi:hypothetical protein
MARNLGGGPKTRERRPGQEAAHLKNTGNSNTADNTQQRPDFQEALEIAAARHLARRYFLRPVAAKIIARELRLGGCWS